jgi:Recombinase
MSARRGRPPACPRELAVRIVSMRRQGLSYREIGVRLNTQGVLTPMGRPWRKGYVERVLHTQYARDIMTEIGGW